MLHILYFSLQIPLAISSFESFFLSFFFYSFLHVCLILLLKKKEGGEMNFKNCLTKTHVYLHVLFRMHAGQLTLFISTAALFVLKV